MVNLDTIGGVEELFVHFLENAKAHRHHILVTGGKIHPYFLETITKYAASITYEKYLFGFKIPKVLRQLKRKYALQKKYAYIVLWNRFEKIKSSAKVIYYEHGASWIDPKGSNAGEFFNTVDFILANSKAAKRILELKWGIQKPIAVIDNPLRPDLPFSDTPRTEFHTPFRIGYIGRLIPLKGVALLLSALRILVNRGIAVELFIAGEGQEKAKLQLEAQGLPVHFYGAIDNVTAFYDSIDLLVIPSIREPLGLVALEAEARGVPVIASYVDGLPEAACGYCLPPTLTISRYPEFGGTLEKLPDVVYDPLNDSISPPRLLDPELIAERIEYLMNHPEEYQELSRAAIHFTKQRINFAQYAEKLLTFFF
ncbi:MAG: glycosyltransferase [Chlamydiia bacterium]|nr:glycosyltransferase [Chlamydiia bacterium]